MRCSKCSGFGCLYIAAIAYFFLQRQRSIHRMWFRHSLRRVIKCHKFTPPQMFIPSWVYVRIHHSPKRESVIPRGLRWDRKIMKASFTYMSWLALPRHWLREIGPRTTAGSRRNLFLEDKPVPERERKTFFWFRPAVGCTRVSVEVIVTR